MSWVGLGWITKFGPMAISADGVDSLILHTYT